MSLVSFSDNFGHADQFISKLSITVAIYQHIWIIQCKQNSMQRKHHTHIQLEKNYLGLFFVVEEPLAEKVQNLQLLLIQ